MTTFEDLYGRTAEVRACAPGRVNLIGEHTDYNDGFVLPLPIPQETCVELARREDGRVRAWSSELDGTVHEYALGAERRTGGWIDFVQGVTEALAHGGFAIRGFDARVSSAVPVGSGLSSSAALEVSLLRALREAYRLQLDGVTIARLGRRAENELVGAPVGIMDQMASSLGTAGAALFLDTRTLSWERVPLPAGLALLVISSGVTHRHGAGEYRTRRAECDRAAELLGVPKLRDVSVAELPRVERLPTPLDRRARHVITENARVLAAVTALRAGDAAELGRLLDRSHASMRDDFEVSIPEIDLLVELTRGRPGVYGARLTGGGFGGSIVALAASGGARSLAVEAAAEYAARSGLSPKVLLPVS